MLGATTPLQRMQMNPFMSSAGLNQPQVGRFGLRKHRRELRVT